jgi:hypothetical protein
VLPRARADTAPRGARRPCWIPRAVTTGRPAPPDELWARGRTVIRMRLYACTLAKVETLARCRQASVAGTAHCNTLSAICCAYLPCCEAMCALNSAHVNARTWLTFTLASRSVMGWACRRRFAAASRGAAQRPAQRITLRAHLPPPRVAPGRVRASALRDAWLALRTTAHTSNL